MEEIWSNTDFPYMCLKDEIRTRAFQKAIQSVVQSGDIVVDVGSGSGILAFFAAASGASKVYAVEIEHLLAKQLRKSIQANRFENKIEVIESNILKAKLPENVNVVISELIDTALMDEPQVAALNHLRRSGIVTNKTLIIPSMYKTYIELVNTDNMYYGFKILAPKHEWPFYKNKDTNWLQTKFESVSDKVEIHNADFMSGLIQEKVEVDIKLHLEQGKKANGVRISGVITLAEGIELNATNALNGDKILAIDPIENKSEVAVRVSYKMGGSLGSARFEVV